MAYSLKGVTFDYTDELQTYRALSDVTIDVESGSFVAIIGASGSGKSTLMNCLGCLAAPTSGDLFIKGIRTSDLTENERAALRNRHIGFIFQHFALLPRLSVFDNVMLPAAYALDLNAGDLRQLKTRAWKLLEELGIADKAERLPAELSGGQRQRVAICRALLLNPDILLADEPTGALDSKTTADVLGIFERLNQQGKTVVIITHDPAVAAHAKRIIEIKDGSVVRQSETTALSGTPPIVTLNEPHSQPFLSESQRISTGSSKLMRWFIEPIFDFVRFRAQISVRAVRNLMAHKLRTALTGLGLLIGVASIIVIAGLGEMVQDVFTKLFYNSANSKVYIYQDSDRTREKGPAVWNGLTGGREFSAFAALFEKYGHVRPWLRSGTCNFVSANKLGRGRVVGMYDQDEFTELDTPLVSGRFPSTLEFLSGAPVVVLGNSVTDQLFAKTYPGRANPGFPLGEKIATSQCDLLQSFTIIGVLGPRDTAFDGRDLNDLLYASVPSMLKGMGPVRFRFFTVLPHKNVEPLWLATHITKYLTARNEDRIVFDHKIPAEIIEKIRSFLHIIQGLTGFIGSLCILVGGIGIMNIMIVTVTERTREIGIMKSLGARPFHIRNQFLSESITLCILACVIGVCLGVVLNNSLALAGSLLQPNLGGFRFILAPWGIGVGLVVSCLCGIGFGFLPAFRAGNMDPAACLREE